MRVLVCGGRDFDNRNLVNYVLNNLDAQQRIDVIIHGDAPGADLCADDWARHRQIAIVRYPADWTTHGKSTGPKRNARMLTDGRPDLVVAFPGGKGTADMVKRARKAKIQVIVVTTDGEMHRDVGRP